MMFWIIFIILLSVAIILNIAAWIFPSLCDWYTIHIMPWWYNSYGRFNNLFKFSVGEIMLILLVLLILASVVMLFTYAFGREKPRLRKIVKGFYKMEAMILAVVCVIMTLNCSMLYHCTPIDANPDVAYREYSLDELETARNYIVEQCNLYSTRIKRDENGYILYDGNMQDYAKYALHNISDVFPKLKGYYPDVKHMMFSDVLSQAYIAGYYFPFSMEANCNDNMYIINYPEVYCHELSHLHGYIYEDEANYISFLACTSTDDDFFIYSGYLSVLNYIDNAYIESLNGDTARYKRQVKIDKQVREDNVFLLPDTWEKVEAKAVVSTDTVNNASDTFINTSLHMNGVSDGIATYGKVVDLVLQYYDGVLY